MIPPNKQNANLPDKPAQKTIENSYVSTSFCWCGRKLDYFWGIFVCPLHKGNCVTPPPKRERIGKYSGKSKRPYGAYEKY
jgi:hypothetical protein